MTPRILILQEMLSFNMGFIHKLLTHLLESLKKITIQWIALPIFRATGPCIKMKILSALSSKALNVIFCFWLCLLSLVQKTSVFHLQQGRSQNFQRGGSPADTNNYDRFDAPIALNTREV